MSLLREKENINLNPDLSAAVAVRTILLTKEQASQWPFGQENWVSFSDEVPLLKHYCFQ